MKGQTASDSAGEFRRRCVRFNDEKCSLWAQLPKDGYALVKSALWSRARRHDHPERERSRLRTIREPMCGRPGRSLCRGGRAEPAKSRHEGPGRRSGGTPPWSCTPTWSDSSMVTATARPRSRARARYRPKWPAVWPATRDITLSFDAPDGTVPRPEGPRTGPDRCATDRDPTPRRRVSVPRLPVSQRDRRAPRDVGLQTGSDRYVEPVDAVCRPPLPRSRAGLEAGRRCAGRGAIHQPERAGVRLESHANLAPASKMSAAATAWISCPSLAAIVRRSSRRQGRTSSLRSGRSTLTPLPRGRVSQPGRTRSFPAGIAPAGRRGAWSCRGGSALDGPDDLVGDGVGVLEREHVALVLERDEPGAGNRRHHLIGLLRHA